MHDFVHQKHYSRWTQNLHPGEPSHAGRYKTDTSQTSTRNQFTVCTILQCCGLLFLHLRAWLHEKTLFQRPIYIEVSRFKNARKRMQKESFKSWGKAWNKHFERNKTSCCGEGSKLVVEENSELTYSHEHIKSTPTCRAIPPEEDMSADWTTTAHRRTT